MDTYTYENLQSHLKSGHVYRRDMLLSFSTALDRDLGILVKQGELKKLSSGIYYKPALSAFGVLPPDDKELVRCFLRDNQFLLYSWNQYNSLELGLTQLYNRVIVLNNKRHGIFKLGNKEFDFRRSNRGFPKKLTREFLLVDLLNNINELAEDTFSLKERIQNIMTNFDQANVFLLAKKYGKVSTKKFFKAISDHAISTSAS
ncbi:MAG: DUF6088 family protein [Gammaproteobacteria bacterium]|nr:DUF6088 family protein [Gammaproteobacteria bacterium]